MGLHFPDPGRQTSVSSDPLPVPGTVRSGNIQGMLGVVVPGRPPGGMGASAPCCFRSRSFQSGFMLLGVQRAWRPPHAYLTDRPPPPPPHPHQSQEVLLLPPHPRAVFVCPSHRSWVFWFTFTHLFSVALLQFFQVPSGCSKPLPVPGLLGLWRGQAMEDTFTLAPLPGDLSRARKSRGMASFLHFALAAGSGSRPASLLFTGLFCSVPITFPRGCLILSFLSV